jgi:hypothetical protein
VSRAIIDDIFTLWGTGLIIKRPWVWLCADVVTISGNIADEHSWVECDEWAIDASDGAEGLPVRAIRAAEYRRLYPNLKNIQPAVVSPKCVRRRQRDHLARLLGRWPARNLTSGSEGD